MKRLEDTTSVREFSFPVYQRGQWASHGRRHRFRKTEGRPRLSISHSLPLCRLIPVAHSSSGRIQAKIMTRPLSPLSGPGIRESYLLDTDPFCLSSRLLPQSGQCFSDNGDPLLRDVSHSTRETKEAGSHDRKSESRLTFGYSSSPPRTRGLPLPPRRLADGGHRSGAARKKDGESFLYARRAPLRGSSNSASAYSSHHNISGPEQGRESG